MPACSTCRTCASSTSRRRRNAPRAFLRYALANNVDKLTVPGKALYSCLLRDDGGVLDDLIVYFLREDFFRLVVNAGDRRQGHRVAHARLRRRRAPGLTITPRDRPRDDRRAGPACAREGVARGARQRGGDGGARSRSTRRRCDAIGRALHRAHRLHRRGRLRDHAARRRTPKRCGTRCRRPASRRAASARATRCASKPA